MIRLTDEERTRLWWENQGKTLGFLQRVTAQAQLKKAAEHFKGKGLIGQDIAIYIGAETVESLIAFPLSVWQEFCREAEEG